MATSAAIAVAAVLGGLSLAQGTLAVDTPDPARQDELIHLLRHDCGSCHGLTLKGGLGPPLLPGRMKTVDAGALAAIIRDGVPGTPMPPWGPLLSDAEIDWLVQQIMTGVGDEH